MRTSARFTYIGIILLDGSYEDDRKPLLYIAGEKFLLWLSE